MKLYDKWFMRATLSTKPVLSLLKGDLSLILLDNDEAKLF